MKSKTAGLEPFTDFLWSREDYEDLVARGVFGPEDKIELLDGKLITMAPQHSRHSTAYLYVKNYLERIFRDSPHVRSQVPLSLDSRSQPEPDVAVVPGTIADYASQHPTTALLVVEIAETSLSYDRGPKLRAYARAGIPEYWIANLIDRVVEVYRHPSGERYEQSRTVHPGSTPSIPPISSPDPAPHPTHPRQHSPSCDNKCRGRDIYCHKVFALSPCASSSSVRRCVEAPLDTL